MSHEENVQVILDKYFTIKELYIECEETDPELKTNLQPLNEFRAILDHIMKLVYANQFEGREETDKQYEKLNSHLDRCFYDVCDMLSINYRNKIVDILDLYDVETIRQALPTYYSEMKPKIAQISNRVMKYRTDKGNPGKSQKEILASILDYKNDVYSLREIYQTVINATGSMDEISAKTKKAVTTKRLWDLLIGGLLGAVASGTIVALICAAIGI